MINVLLDGTKIDRNKARERMFYYIYGSFAMENMALDSYGPKRVLDDGSINPLAFYQKIKLNKIFNPVDWNPNNTWRFAASCDKCYSVFEHDSESGDMKNCPICSESYSIDHDTFDQSHFQKVYVYDLPWKTNFTPIENIGFRFMDKNPNQIINFSYEFENFCDFTLMDYVENPEGNCYDDNHSFDHKTLYLDTYHELNDDRVCNCNYRKMLASERLVIL